MTSPGDLDPAGAQELFEDAPCGYLATTLDGTITRVNRTFERLAGRERDELVGRRRFQELLSPGGRIYHETHCAPLLRMQGSIREIALEIVRADGERRPVLVNSVIRPGAGSAPGAVWTLVFEAGDRRRYEDELLRAREHEHGIAIELERSLLAGPLPEDERFEVGVAYRPAGRGEEVGGDWYDAFALEDPATFALVVGDVVGRGISAAAAMGQLRSAARAFVATGLGPAAVLDALEDYVVRHDVGALATVVHVHVDVDARTARYACAGHPPPLLVGPGADARFLWDGRSLPLDADPGHARSDAVVELPPAATLVLYTDGIVERRGRALDEGMAALQEAAVRLLGLPAAGIAETLADTLGAGDDDVCVLVLRTAA